MSLTRLSQLFHNVDFSRRKSWGAAQEDCLSRGASLVTIHLQAEEEFLSLYTKGTSKWIGLMNNPTLGGGLHTRAHTHVHTLHTCTRYTHTLHAHTRARTHTHTRAHARTHTHTLHDGTH